MEGRKERVRWSKGSRASRSLDPLAYLTYLAFLELCKVELVSVWTWGQGEMGRQEQARGGVLPGLAAMGRGLYFVWRVVLHQGTDTTRSPLSPAASWHRGWIGERGSGNGR